MKRGEKYVIEIAEVHNHYDDKLNKYKLGRIKGFSSLVFDEFGLAKLDKFEDKIEAQKEIHDTLLSTRNFYMRKYHENKDKNDELKKEIAELKKENKKLDKMIDKAIQKIFSLSDTIGALTYGEEQDEPNVWSMFNQMKSYKERLAKQVEEKVEIGTDNEIFSEQTANILGEHRE